MLKRASTSMNTSLEQAGIGFYFIFLSWFELIFLDLSKKIEMTRSSKEFKIISSELEKFFFNTKTKPVITNVYKCKSQVREFWNLFLNALLVKNKFSIYFRVEMSSKYCMNKRAEHKSNRTYAIVAKSGIQVRCYDVSDEIRSATGKSCKEYNSDCPRVNFFNIGIDFLFFVNIRWLSLLHPTQNCLQRRRRNLFRHFLFKIEPFPQSRVFLNRNLKFDLTCSNWLITAFFSNTRNWNWLRRWHKVLKFFLKLSLKTIFQGEETVIFSHRWKKEQERDKDNNNNFNFN